MTIPCAFAAAKDAATHFDQSRHLRRSGPVSRVRRRLWEVVSRWYGTLGRGAIVTVWRDADRPGELAIEILGEPPKEIVGAAGVLLVKRK